VVEMRLLDGNIGVRHQRVSLLGRPRRACWAIARRWRDDGRPGGGGGL
jgi:hypothetical protein